MNKRSWLFIPIVLFSLLVFFLWRGLALDPHVLPSVQIGKALPAFRLPLLGTNQWFTPELLQGRVVLLNVWASWCTACIEEHAFLLKLAQTGFPIVGLNYKDDTQNAQNWLHTWGNPYQLIAEDKAGKLAIDLGVYGTPETFLIDKKGFIRYRHVGIVDEDVWQKEFLPCIEKLKGKA